MNSFTGSDVYGIRWWIDNKDNDGGFSEPRSGIEKPRSSIDVTELRSVKSTEDDFLSSIKYTEKYDSIMTKKQIQNAKNEFEKLDVEEIKKVRVQVYLYIYVRKERAWWCIDTDKIQLWFSKNC
jgi:hypothetical protein